MGPENAVSAKVNEVFCTTFEIDFDGLPEKTKSENLLSENFYFRARDLLTLLVKLEREFKIEIPEKRIKNGEFNTFHNIVNMITEQVSMTGM